MTLVFSTSIKMIKNNDFYEIIKTLNRCKVGQTGIQNGNSIR